MYQVWMNDRLYGVWSTEAEAQSIVDALEVKYPYAKLEIRMFV